VKCSHETLLLYGITGGSNPLPLVEQVKAAIAGGITFLQLREKHLPQSEVVREARELYSLCRASRIPFVINDDVEAALLADVDGVHIGQSDAKLAEARRILGAKKIIGVSAHTVAEAVAAEQGGADYLGVGAMFATATKRDAEIVSMDELKAICRAVTIPVVVIGGISMETLPQFQDSGACGAAVISAIFSQPDIASATRAMKRTALTFLSGRKGK